MSSFQLISRNLPMAKILSFAQIGVAVSSIEESMKFYAKIGFVFQEATDSVTVMKNHGGLELHLTTCDKEIEENKNLLMDYPESKYPGHTHAAFTVQSVPNAKKYLTEAGLVISGERPGQGRVASVFVRDLDRTTFEFENDHGDNDIEITPQLIGYPQCMDHVGIRVTKPDEKWLWYADVLGFNRNIMRYELNSNPLVNSRPFISQTETGVNINFIPNANISTPGSNILLVDGVARPGIIYISFFVESIANAIQQFQQKIPYYFDLSIEKSPLGLKLRHIFPILHNRSVFICDEDNNIIRLIEKRKL